MVIYLTHPIHGAKVATLDIEAAEDEKNGWTRYNPDEAAPVNALEKRPRRTKPVEETEGL